MTLPSHVARIVRRARTGRDALRLGSLQGQDSSAVHARFEVLALEMGDRERADLGESILRDLVERGLNWDAVGTRACAGEERQDEAEWR